MSQENEDLLAVLEEKYEGVKELLSVGKEKGYLLYDEVNDLLPDDIQSSEDLDNIFYLFGEAGIEMIDSDDEFEVIKKKTNTDSSGEEETETETTSEDLEKTNDPVRMYLREMGTVPLLTREGEVEIAKRIEKGKRTVLKAISRAPLVVHEIRQYLIPLADPGFNLKHFVLFTEEEITPEVLDAKRQSIVQRIEKISELEAEATKFRA